MPDDLSQLERTAGDFRRDLLAHDRSVSRAMIDAYGETWQRLKARIDALNAQIRDARLVGETVNSSWLFQRNRLQMLQIQVEQEIAEFARYAATQIAGGQAVAVELAGEHAEGLARAGLGEPPPGVTVTWSRLPREAVTDLVGFLSDGSPLSDLLGELPGEAGSAVRKALIVGVATGQNPRTVARMIRQELGGNLVRALTISRTEILRSYRSASLRSYQANSDVVKGWTWHSALDRRTCMSCVAMHGTFHRLDERLDDHPNGRCSALPVTKTWKELGLEGVPETRVQVEKGSDWFARQPESVQRQMMGPAKFAAWKDGTFDLKDVVGRTRDPRWGTMRVERSLKDILGENDAASYLKAARMRSPSSGSGSGFPPTGVPPTATSGGGYSAAEQTIRQIEDRIRTNPTESLHAVDQNGNVVLSKQGAQYEVDLSPAEIALLRDTIVTHNHPRGLGFTSSDPRSGGNSFSRDDICTACDASVAEMRAVTPVWRFIMKRPASGWDTQYWQQVIYPVFRQHDLQVGLDFWQAIGNGAMTRAQAEAQHYHEVWTRVARDLGLDYRREL